MNPFTLSVSAANIVLNCRQILNYLPHNFTIFIRNYTAQKIESCSQFNRTKNGKTRSIPVTHVIFDLDGTILNTEEIIFCAAKHYLKRVFNKELTWEFYSMLMGTGSSASAKKVVKEFKLPINSDVYLHGIWQELRIKLHQSQVLPGVERLINYFFKCEIPIALATTSSEEMFKLKAKHHGALFEKFCVMVFAPSERSLFGRYKPHPDIFYLAASRFPIPPKEPCNVLVFEDSIMGVRAALAAKMQVVMTPSERVPDHILQLVEPTVKLKNLALFDPTLFHLPSF